MRSVDNDLSKRLLSYAAKAIKLMMKLDRNSTTRYIANQFIRSATSLGANYEEACGAESRADFLHKIQLVLKELKESIYWLKLIIRTELLENAELVKLFDEACELSKIFAKSVLTAKSNIK